MRKVVLASFAAVAVLNCVAVAGPKWELGEDSYMDLKLLGQLHYSHMDDASMKDDFYLRRARLILSGRIMDGLDFFVETDNDNAGRNGMPSSSTDIQDAFVDLRLGESDHWVKAGLILLPFSFETRASAASLLGLDYNSEAVKLVNTFVWRDYGAELHGGFGNRFAYAAGVFDGYDTPGGSKNEEAALRFTGHVALNIMGNVEKGWFYSQERLGKSGNYLSVGAGYDNQEDATLVTVQAATEDTPAITTPRDSEAFVFDFQSGFQAGAVNITVNGAYYDWDSSSYDGNTAFMETGVRLAKTMVVFKYSRQDPDADIETEDYTAGLHYFLKGHNARTGIEYRWGDSDDLILAGIQFLL